MHLDQEVLSRLVDGELSSDEVRRAEAHLAGCPECSARKEQLASTDAFVSGLLPYADEPTPDVDPDELIRRARPAPSRPIRRWAAAIVLTAVGAGAAYAAPGSPLPALLDWSDQADPEPSQLRPDPSPSGLLLPAEAPLVIEFTGMAGSGSLIVTRVPGPGIAIESTREGVSYESEAGRVTVSGGTGASGDFLLNVPPDASGVTVTLDGRPVWRLEAGRVETDMSESPEGAHRMAF